jgi:hypothetical protein
VRSTTRKRWIRRGNDSAGTPVGVFGFLRGLYAAQYLKKHELATEGTVVRVSAEKAQNPPRMDDFRIEVEIPSVLNDQHRVGTEEAIRHCLIHNTLLNAPRISLAVKAGALLSV